MATPCVSSANQQVFGGAPGTFAVTPDGSAGYSMRLRVPPGTGGMQPELGIAYTSGASNGLLGMGFTLSGLSAITRVGATEAQDNFHSAVAYDEHDRLALDGSRLMPVSGKNYFDGVVYHTEIESWQKVVPSYKGAVSGQHGPVFFTVRTKDGKVLQYGDKPGEPRNASIPASASNPSIRIWALASITDRNKNTMTFTYDPDPTNNNSYPSQINYTSHGKLAANRAVRFHYVARNDPFTSYIGGFPVTTTQILQSIQTLVSDEVVTTWCFDYQYGAATGRAQLTNIHEIGADNSVLPPTTFSWPVVAPGLQKPVALAPTPAFSTTTIPMDLDGNGLVDLIVATNNFEQLGLSFLQSIPIAAGSQVASSAGVYLAPPVDILGDVSIPYGSLYPMDVNGDGAMDLVVATQNFSNTELTVLLATETNGSWSLEVAGDVGGAGPADLSAGIIASLDVNGDGLADLVCASENPNVPGELALQILLSNGTSFTAAPLYEAKNVPYYQGASLIPLDFNGDGMTDLLYTWSRPDDTVDAVLFFSTGTSFRKVNDLFKKKKPLYGATLFALDLNGDGKDDLVQVTSSPFPSLQTWFSNGASERNAQFVDGQTLRLKGFTSGSGAPPVLPLDFNGDSLPDLAIAVPDFDNTSITLLQNNGTEFTQLAGSVTAPSSFLLPLDVNGDGKTEVLSVMQQTDGSAALAVMLTDGPYPDLVGSIVNPLGGVIDVDYLPLTNPAVYSKSIPSGETGSPISMLGQFSGRVTGAVYQIGSSAAVTPGSTRATKIADFPKYVVSQYQRISGETGVTFPADSQIPVPTQTYTWAYQYAQGLIDLQGRGWLGFAQLSAQDDDSQTLTTTSYNQTFPLTGSPSVLTIASTTPENDGALMKMMQYTYTTPSISPVNNMTIWQVLEKTVTTNFYTYADTATKFDCQLVRTHTYDDYGNQLTLSETGDAYGAPLYLQFEYENRTKPWHLGFMTSQTTTSDAAGKDVLAQRTFAYGPRMNLISVSDRVTDKVSYTVKYRYDTYGNCIQKTDVSGAKTRYFYDSTGSFPARVVSPPSIAGKKLVGTSVYDSRFGVMTESTDWNHVKKTQTLDGFGRVTAVSTANPRDKGDVQLSSVSWNQDPATNAIYRQTDTLVAWDGTSKWTRQYVDGFGRAYRITALGPDGKGTTVVEKEFNSDNQEVRSSLPHYEGEAFAHVVTHYDPYMRTTRIHRVSSDKTTVTEFSYPSTNETVRIDAAGTAQRRRTVFHTRAFAGHHVVVTRQDNLGFTTQFDYDPLGRLRTLEDPLGVRKIIEYDDLGRMIASSAHNATTKFYSETTAYDAHNRLVIRTDAKKNVVRSTHDQLGRLIELSATPGSGGKTEFTSFTWDGPKGDRGTRGRPSAVKLPDGTTYTYSYDPIGSRKQTIVSIGGGTHTFERLYTPLNDLEETVFPDETVERFERNAAGALSGVTYGPLPHHLAAVKYHHQDAYGNPRHAIYGNGVHETRVYDELNRLGSIKVEEGTSSLADRTWQYYPNDAIESITDNAGDASESYQYDGVGRLLTATGPYGTASFQYDGGGNIKLKDGIIYTSDGHQVQNGKDASGNIVFTGTYDANGNLSTARRGSDQTTYTFDALDRLVAAGSTTMAYDHIGRRIRRSPANENTVYSVTPDYCVYDKSGASVALLSGAFGTMAAYTKGSDPDAPPAGVTYLHTNHLGSSIVTTGTNDPAESLLYAPFGTPQQTPPSSVIPTFTGKTFDDDTQLYAFGGRYYDAGLGRFISHDVKQGGNLLRSDAFHGYAYVANDPTNLFDPSGYSIGDDFASWFSWTPFSSIGDWFQKHWQTVVSYSLDGLMIVGGIALTAMTFGGASVILASMAAGALLGGGISGLVTNISDSATGKAFSWKDWGISVGTGAAAGAASGLLSGAMTFVAAARAAAAVAQGVTQASEDAVTRVFYSALKEAFSNGVGNTVGTVVQNALNHQSLGAGVGSAIALGATFGFASGGLSDAIGTAYANSARSTVLDSAGAARSSIEDAKDFDAMAVNSKSNREMMDMMSENDVDRLANRGAGLSRVSDKTDALITRFQKTTRLVNAAPGVFIEDVGGDTTKWWL